MEMPASLSHQCPLVKVWGFWTRLTATFYFGWMSQGR